MDGVKYETKSKAEDPGFLFHDSDKASGQAYCAKVHIVALERGQAYVNWPILCRLTRISVPGGRKHFDGGKFLCPNGHQSTVNAAGHPPRNRCDIVEVNFIIHTSASIDGCLEFCAKRLATTGKGKRNGLVQHTKEGFFWGSQIFGHAD